MHQLHSIPIPCDGFTWFQQLIIHHTELVPPNAEHNLGNVNIRSGRRLGGLHRPTKFQKTNDPETRQYLFEGFWSAES